MSFFFFAWVSSVAYGISYVFEKLTSKYIIQNVWLFNFATNLLSLIFVIPIAVMSGLGRVGDWPDIIYAALFWALGNIFFFLALYMVDISILSPSFNIKVVFALLLGTFFLGETLTSFQFWLVLIILSAGLFIFYDEKLWIKSFFTMPMFIVFIDNFFLAVYNMFVKRATATTDFWTVVFWIQLLTVIFLLPTIPLFYRELFAINWRQIGITTFITVLSTIGLVAATKAYSFNIGLSAVIGAVPLSMIFAFFLTLIKPGLLEKHPLKVYIVRFFAATIMVIAAITLSLN